MADAPPYTRADSTKQVAKPAGWCLWLLAARGRYAAGVWAMPLALAPAFLLAALLGVPPPLEPLTEGLMQPTPFPSLTRCSPSSAMLRAWQRCSARWPSRCR